MKRQPYHDDPYVFRFEAGAKRVSENGHAYDVELDTSFFYPESGGQLSDSGTVDGIPLLGLTTAPDGTVIHTLGERPPARRLLCVIDEQTRLSHMRSHTGQHILSAVIDRLFNAKTVSFHMSDCFSTIDAEGCPFDGDALKKIQAEVNEVIMKDIPVESFWISQDEAYAYKFRKMGKHDGDIRVVRIEETDVSMCAGTHVARTGETGPFVISGIETVKGGLLRIEFRCGARAVEWANMCTDVLQGLKRLFSVPASGILSSAGDIVKARSEQERSLRHARQRIAELTALTAFKSTDKRVCVDTDLDDPETAVSTARELVRLGAVRAAVYASRIKTLILVSSDGSAENAGRRVKESYGAKGGGKGDFYRISEIKLASCGEALEGVF